MSIQTEKKLIIGKLIAQGQAWDLLDLKPTTPRDLSWLLREGVFQFYVVVNGFAQYILVAREAFVIVPYLEPYEEDVNYIIEDEKGVDTESNEYAVRNIIPNTVYSVDSLESQFADKFNVTD